MSHTNTAAFWEEFYRRGSIDWDLGAPTPVFRSNSQFEKEGVN